MLNDFFPAILVDTLDRVNIGDKKRVDVPNNSPILNPIYSDLQGLAEYLGITLQSAGHTYTISITKEGKRNIYGPAVTALDGVPGIAWGFEFIPLNELTAPSRFGEYEGRIIFEVETDDTAGESVYFPVSIKRNENKQLVADIKAIRKAHKDGSLGSLLNSPQYTTTKLKDVPVGTYKLLSVQQIVSFGQDKMSLLIQSETGTKYSTEANTALYKKLQVKLGAGHEISREVPAELKILGETGRTQLDHPIIGIELTTKADLEAPAFSL